MKLKNCLYLGVWDNIADEHYIAKHLCKYLNVEKKSIYALDFKNNYDIILTAIPAKKPPGFWSMFKGYKIAHYFDLVINTPRERQYIPSLSKFNLVFSPENVRYPGVNHAYLQQGFEPSVLFPVRVSKNRDVGFLGRIYSDERKQIVNQVKADVGLGLRGKDFSKFVNSHKINLCLSAPVKLPGYWSARVYQILGCGGFVIHYWEEGLEDEFEDGKHLVTYCGIEDLKEKIDFYLKHDYSRQKISVQGYERVFNFTWERRVEQLWNAISKLV